MSWNRSRACPLILTYKTFVPKMYSTDKLGCMYESGEAVARDLKEWFEHFDFGVNRLYQVDKWKVATVKPPDR